MSEQSSQRIEREVVETFKAGNNVRVDAVNESCGDDARQYLDVYRLSTERYRSIETGEAEERPIREKIARIPSGRGYDVLQGLAEAYDCEVDPR